MIYSFQSRVRFSEIDETGRIKPYSILNYLQDVATFQGQEVGFGVDWTRESRKVWVIASCQMQVEEYPRFGDEIRISTWATSARGMIGCREFSITSPDQAKTYVIAKSDWVYLDLQKNRPIHVDDVQLAAYGVHPEKKLTEDLGKRKISVPDAGGQASPAFAIQEFQLDTNGHVNNGQWTQMALQHKPEGMQIRKIRVEFKRQAFLDNLIVPVVYTGENSCIVSLNDEAGEPYCILEMKA